jgi:hypothetical protein
MQRLASKQHPSVISADNVLISTASRDDAFMIEADAKKFVLTHAPKNAFAVYNLLDLVRNKVRGDGSCWVYAILATFGLCEHVHPRTEQDATPIDRTRDLFCRMMSEKALREHVNELKLTDADLRSLDDICIQPKYPFDENCEDDYGSFGTDVTVVGLVFHMKTTVVLWNFKTLRNRRARQTVMQWIPKDGVVKQRAWNNDEILLYSLQHEAIHIEWNGDYHYASLVPKRFVRIDPSVMTMLSQEAIPWNDNALAMKSRGKRAIEVETDASPKLQLPPKKGGHQ